MKNFIQSRKIIIPAVQSFEKSDQLVLLPTLSGLYLYVPSPEDFFFRAPLIDGKRPPFVPGMKRKFGSVDTRGINSNKRSILLRWTDIFPLISEVVKQVVDDYYYFHKVDLSLAEYQGLNLGLLSCEVNSLMGICQFYIACCACSDQKTGLTSRIMFQSLFNASVMAMVMSAGPQQMGSDEMFLDWITRVSRLFNLTPSTGEDMGGLVAYKSLSGVIIQMTHRGGIRIPIERTSRVLDRDDDSFGNTSSFCKDSGSIIAPIRSLSIHSPKLDGSFKPSDGLTNSTSSTSSFQD